MSTPSSNKIHGHRIAGWSSSRKTILWFILIFFVVFCLRLTFYVNFNNDIGRTEHRHIATNTFRLNTRAGNIKFSDSPLLPEGSEVAPIVVAPVVKYVNVFKEIDVFSIPRGLGFTELDRELKADKFAYVLLSYSNFVLPVYEVVAKSLRVSGSDHPIILMVTDGVEIDRYDIVKLNAVGVTVRNIPVFDVDRAEVERFSKLHIWNLVEFTRVIFLDMDVLITRNPDNLFYVPFDLIAVPNFLFSDIIRTSWRKGKTGHMQFSSGVMVVTPSVETFEMLSRRLLQYSSESRFVDQPFFNQVYRQNWLALPLRYNCNKRIVTVAQRYDPRHTHLVHYLGAKPWEKLDSKYDAKAGVWRHPPRTKHTNEEAYGMADQWWFSVADANLGPLTGIARPVPKPERVLLRTSTYATLLRRVQDAPAVCDLAATLLGTSHVRLVAVTCIELELDDKVAAFLEDCGVQVVVGGNLGPKTSASLSVEVMDGGGSGQRLRQGQEVGSGTSSSSNRMCSLWIKLHLWSLPYTSVVFVDLQGRVQRNLDHLLVFPLLDTEVMINDERDTGPTSCTASLMVLQPSVASYQLLLQSLSSSVAEGQGAFCNVQEFIEWFFGRGYRMGTLPSIYGCPRSDFSAGPQAFYRHYSEDTGGSTLIGCDNSIDSTSLAQSVAAATAAEEALAATAEVEEEKEGGVDDPAVGDVAAASPQPSTALPSSSSPSGGSTAAATPTPLSAPSKRFAYATFTTDLEEALPLVERYLLPSLAATGSPYPLVIIFPQTLHPSAEMLERLGASGVAVIGKPVKVYTKGTGFPQDVSILHAWGMVEYTKVLLLAPDSVLVRNVDHLFELSVVLAATPAIKTTAVGLNSMDYRSVAWFHTRVMLLTPDVGVETLLARKVVESDQRTAAQLLNMNLGHLWLSLPFRYNLNLAVGELAMGHFDQNLADITHPSTISSALDDWFNALVAPGRVPSRLPPLSSLATAPRPAYVTFIETPQDISRTFAIHTALKVSGTTAPMAVLTCEGVLDEAGMSALNKVGIHVFQVPPVPVVFFPDTCSEWALIHLWGLPFTSIVYLGPKVIVRKNIDGLFTLPMSVELSINDGRLAQPNRCTGSIMALAPSVTTYSELLHGFSSVLGINPEQHMRSVMDYFEWFFGKGFRMSRLPRAWGCYPGHEGGNEVVGFVV